ncbi:hypothetical protein NFI95_00560 [Acetobacteraceae bacterium KSS8]|uniref:AsmA-like C-terminal domain-containing protein n=1 Tax=Endosaccharibacter trunci TaxID=2812733 RepID=A0ABT1W246_9PROT|nr:hypothetical protein [Acetobacteraceae bacterium KSS8]
MLYALRVLVALPVLAALFLVVLWLRLSWGPIEIGWLAHRLAPERVAGERLGFGRAWIARPGSGGIAVGADAISLRPDAGPADLSASRLEVSVRAAPLLAGVIALETVSLRDADLSLLRQPDGRIALAGAPSPPGRDSGEGDGPLRFDHLRAVSVDRLEARLVDRRSGHRFAASVTEAHLSPWGGALASGVLRATLSVDGRSVPVRGDGAPDGKGLRWHAETGAIRPSDFAGIVPALAAIGTPVTPVLVADFAPGEARPRTAQVSVGLGAGTVAVGDGTLPVESGRVELDLHRSGANGVGAVLRSWRLALAPPPTPGPGPSAPPSGSVATEAEANDGDAPVFSGSGTASVDNLFRPRRIRAALSLNSDAVRFAGIDRYWPAGVAAGARRWITENMTAGTATGLHVETVLAGNAGWSSLHETQRSGGFAAHDLEMWWLRPMPPLQHMVATATFQGTDALLVESPSATLPVEAVGPEAERLRGKAVLQKLAVSDGSMRITGLTQTQQIGTVHVVLSGGLRSLMCELANPRLSLLSAHPVPFTDPGGTVRSEVTVQLPLDNDVAIEEVAVSAQSRLRGAHLGDVAGGLALDDADLDVSADTNGLVLDGEGAIGPIDSRLHYTMDFRAGGPDQLLEQARVEGTVGAASLAALGVDPGDSISGNGAVTVRYAARRDGMSRIDLALDMTDMGIALPVWSKRAGQKGNLDAAITLDHGHLRSVGPIRAEGPDLSIEGSVATPPRGPRILSVPRFVIGRTRGGGEVSFPRPGAHGTSEPIRISAHGAVLDLAAIIDATPAKAVAAAAKPGPKPAPGKSPAWIADLRFGRVFVGRSTALGGVTAHLENDGAKLVRARVEATDPTPIAVRLDSGSDGRVLDGTAADTGRLLRGLGVTDAVEGGALHLAARLPAASGRSRDAGAPVGGPMNGVVNIDRFILPDAPFAARLIRDLSIYGWLLAPRAPQLTVDRLVAPFSLRGEVLTLSEARAHAAALGVTMRGIVDLGRQTLDLHGTVVPAWALNQLPGRLPIVGKLLAPEKGGGVLAVTLGIKGPFADPRINVNPLSALAPGFLRKLFFR